MEIRRSSCTLAMLLLSLDAVSPGNSPQGLLCVNDFISTLSCAWHGPARAPDANCTITGEKNIWLRKMYTKTELGKMIRSCRLELHENSPPGCSFVFENNIFNEFSKLVSIRMECDGTSVENLTDYKPCNHIKMNPPGVPMVNTTANDSWISWGAGGPWSNFTTTQFHVQIKRKDQLWEEAKDLFTGRLKLKVPSQQFTGLCEVRVRVKPAVPPNQHWSNWSPTTSWSGATEMETVRTWQDEEWLLDQTGLLCSLGVVVVVILLLSAGYLRKRAFKKKPVPNPSKYFCTLQSLNEGNLKAWLNPAEAFFTTQPIDGMSSVEVCDAKASPPSSVLAFASMQSAPSASPDTDGNAGSSSSWSSSSSFYANIDYFLSSTSRSSAPAMRGPAYFTYTDDGDSGNTGITVSLCSSFGNTRGSESLEQEPQSPDSGFSFGKEDEVEKEETEIQEDQICPLLVFPFQHPSPPPPPLSPSHLSSVDSADGGSVCRSSSMNVQPCRTGYLTLKELNMTFSNKSI